MGTSTEGVIEITDSTWIGPRPEGQFAASLYRGGNADIYLVDAGNGDIRRLTTEPGEDVTPTWSPDGRRIAFVSDRSGSSNVYVMDADGSDPVQWTRGTIDQAPAWSPDGSRIAFSDVLDGSSRVVTVSGPGEDPVPVMDYPGWDGHPAWSPDGGRLTFVSDYAAYDFAYDIYTLALEGAAPTRLTRGLVFWPAVSYFLHPAWSPDGTMIAFVYADSSVKGRIDGSFAVRFRVGLMSADGVFMKDLAWAGDLDWMEALDPGSLTWSSDGEGIAYTFVDCADGSGASCERRRSVNYVSLDGRAYGRLVTGGADPSWRR